MAPALTRRHRGWALGEHTDELLAELGLTPADADRLHAAGVLGRSIAA